MDELTRTGRDFRSSGFTLLEIIVTIVVVAIAGTTLLSIFASTVRTSADPMIQQQAIAIAEAYMEEISLMAFADPQGGETGGAEADEVTRSNFDDIQDYNSLTDTVVRDQNGTSIGLNDFNVSVLVGPVELNGIAAAESMRIDITVSHAAVGNLVLSGYRTNYF